ncbi:hypothetical protein LYSHEL_14930 [Lysobacter helvus]|uniref:DUF937 domain-containing protein n=2 Tax=Lysobacteraceae TaxID=32033 RepID=A0ABN6FSN6_9GAMM|nr:MULTISPECIES: hypothetical protein [Lysobacter]BCT92469.1 hypothetical protein LYSCAS_14930 [Lysobacter caseinilyticus]BCT95622.1 hypothetical protein LYSHEL_14930 [Lysobacter helvus]
MSNPIESLLQQITGQGGAPLPPEARDQFQQIAQNASPDELSQGMNAAFQSDQTPPFAQMVAQLFGHADNQQKTGMLSTLLGALGGGATHPALTQAGISSPEQATQLSTDQVQQIATQAEQANPGIVQQMSDFYAKHPQLVQSLGAAAMAIVLGRMRSRH